MQHIILTQYVFAALMKAAKTEMRSAHQPLPRGSRAPRIPVTPPALPKAPVRVSCWRLPNSISELYLPPAMPLFPDYLDNSSESLKAHLQEASVPPTSTATPDSITVRHPSFAFLGCPLRTPVWHSPLALSISSCLSHHTAR